MWTPRFARRLEMHVGIRVRPPVGNDRVVPLWTFLSEIL